MLGLSVVLRVGTFILINCLKSWGVSVNMRKSVLNINVTSSKFPPSLTGGRGINSDFG